VTKGIGCQSCVLHIHSVPTLTIYYNLAQTGLSLLSDKTANLLVKHTVVWQLRHYNTTQVL